MQQPPLPRYRPDPGEQPVAVTGLFRDTEGVDLTPLDLPWRARNTQVLVSRVQAERSAGGLFLPENANQKVSMVLAHSVGPKAQELGVERGGVYLVGEFSGIQVDLEIDGKTLVFFVCEEEELLCAGVRSGDR